MFDDLVADSMCTVRASCAAVLGKMCQLVGKESWELFNRAFIRLLKDPNPVVV